EIRGSRIFERCGFHRAARAFFSFSASREINREFCRFRPCTAILSSPEASEFNGLLQKLAIITLTQQKHIDTTPKRGVGVALERANFEFMVGGQSWQIPGTLLQGLEDRPRVRWLRACTDEFFRKKRAARSA